jgi:CheY-like chemotaxis protein
MLCHERTPDAVVLDLNMPGIDGLSILRHLRILHPTLPVVVFSGHSAKDVEEETLNQGATAFIQKAFSLDLLGSWTKSAFTSRKVNLVNSIRCTAGETSTWPSADRSPVKGSSVAGP